MAGDGSLRAGLDELLPGMVEAQRITDMRLLDLELTVSRLKNVISGMLEWLEEDASLNTTDA